MVGFLSAVCKNVFLNEADIPGFVNEVVAAITSSCGTRVMHQLVVPHDAQSQQVLAVYKLVAIPMEGDMWNVSMEHFKDLKALCQSDTQLMRSDVQIDKLLKPAWVRLADTQSERPVIIKKWTTRSGKNWNGTPGGQISEPDEQGMVEVFVPKAGGVVRFHVSNISWS